MTVTKLSTYDNKTIRNIKRTKSIINKSIKRKRKINNKRIKNPIAINRIKNKRYILMFIKNRVRSII